MKLLVGYATDVGRVREGNEDSFVVDRQLALFAVADGMGGHLGGEVASRTAIEALRAAVASGTSIEDAVRRANAAVYERAGNDPSLYGMGTTLTAIVPTGGSELLIGHVGDSRAYLRRGEEFRRLTEDHSLVEELVREGRITEEQAAVHPQRSIITRVVGVEPELDVDLYPLTVETGDRILICSDGLTAMLDDAGVGRVLGETAEPQATAEQLVDAALGAGGTDNVTVVVIDVHELGDAVDPDAATAEPAIGPNPDDTALLPSTPAAAPDAATVGDSGDPALDARALDAHALDEPGPGRIRRAGRALLWTVVTLAPIAAVGTIGYVVVRNDSSTTTTIPSITSTSVSTSTTSTSIASTPTVAPGP